MKSPVARAIPSLDAATIPPLDDLSSTVTCELLVANRRSSSRTFGLVEQSSIRIHSQSCSVWVKTEDAHDRNASSGGSKTGVTMEKRGGTSASFAQNSAKRFRGSEE